MYKHTPRAREDTLVNRAPAAGSPPPRARRGPAGNKNGSSRSRAIVAASRSSASTWASSIEPGDDAAETGLDGVGVARKYRAPRGVVANGIPSP